MKKHVLVLLFALFQVVVYSQQDFNYTINTTKFKDTILSGTLLRSFKKENNELSVVSFLNTGDGEKYILRYVGVRYESDWCTYNFTYIATKIGFNNKATNNCTISINPTVPTVKIECDGYTITYY